MTGPGAGASAVPGAGAAPVVDVVVAVHAASRPVERAVASVLASRAPVRVTVVCHHLDPALVAERLAPLTGAASLPGGVSLPAAPSDAAPVADEPDGVVVLADGRVRLAPFSDGVASPAGPFTHGLALASAPFVSVMGSDDALAPGALDSWVALARASAADVVLPRLRHGRPTGVPAVPASPHGAPGLRPGAGVATPPARPGRTRALDLVRDRLAYRSAPLGLLRRELVERAGLRMTPGLPVGEDVAFGLGLWWAGARVALDRRGPAYLVGPDASDRVTFTPRPVADELACVLDALARPGFVGSSPAARAAVVVKLVRIHLFGAVHQRAVHDAAWSTADLAALRDVGDALVTAAPGAARVLSRAEEDLLDLVRAAPDVDDAGRRLAAASARRRRHGRPATLVPRDLRALLAREAPLRLMAASVLAARP